MKSSPEKIGLRLKNSRKHAGFRTLSSFTHKYKIPKSTYTQYETGKRNIGVETLLKYCEYLNTNLIWLVTGRGSPHVTNEELIGLCEEQHLAIEDFMKFTDDSFQQNGTTGSQSANKIDRNSDIELLTTITIRVYDIYAELNLTINQKKLMFLVINIYNSIISKKPTPHEVSMLVDIAINTLRTSYTHYNSNNKTQSC